MQKEFARKIEYKSGGKGMKHQTPKGSSAFFIGSRRPPLPPQQ